MLVPLRFKPGLVRDNTHYANTGGWYDCDHVRFREGLPEKIGGWTQAITTQFLGVCRALISYTVLTGGQYLGLGTHTKYYVTDGGTYVDVTPIRLTTNPMANNPFAAVIATTTVTVTDVANGSIEGDYVTFSGSAAVAGIPAAEINIEHQIISIIDADHYTITVTTPATSTASGGGAVVVAAYQLNIGLNTTVYGIGWGTGTWGSGTWGISTGTGVQLGLRLWSHDTFGEDLVTNIRNAGIYYWDASFPTTRMVALNALGGSIQAPTVATQVFVSADERHVVALGCNPIGSAVQDPLFIRWSATESALDWLPSAVNTSGGYRLSVGTRIIGAYETRSEILIWTDQALYSMRWTGVPYTFGFTQLGAGTNMIAPNAAIAVNDVVFWMGREQFYLYDGRIQVMDCPITDHLTSRIDFTQLDKIFAFTNALFTEVGWFYQSIDSDECDSYIIYNYVEKAWYYGTLARTAWLDRGPYYYPLATSADSYLYNQEVGLDDGSTTPPSAITAFIESSPVEMDQDGQGAHFVFISRLIPDVTFRESEAAMPSVDMTISMQDYPGGSFSQQDYASTISQSATVPVEQFTQQAYIRLRGRSAMFRIESDTVGVTWRLGVPRVELRLDGRR